LKKKAEEKRFAFLEELAEAQALEGTTRKEKILRQLMVIERQGPIFRQIKMTLDNTLKGVTAI
jgi:hypothetical protein